MMYQELARWAQKQANFHMQKRLDIYELTRLLALSNDGTNYPSWNCTIVPHREISHLIRSKFTAQTDCSGEFTALIVTRPRQQAIHNTLAIVRDNMRFEATIDKSDSLTAWIMKLIYIARGMNLLVKPLFRFDTQSLQTTLHIPQEQKIVAVLLVGHPEELESCAICPEYIRFHSKSKFLH